MDEPSYIVAKINDYAEHLWVTGARDIANKLRQITGTTRKWNDDFIAKLIRLGTEAYDRELSARGSRPRVLGVITSTIDALSKQGHSWDATDLERLASDIEEHWTTHEIPNG